MTDTTSKIALEGFNNLTKTLSFNIYDICYAKTYQHCREYIEYIDEAYNAERLTKILTDVTQIIGANILNIACQDYEPQGSSVTILISEGHPADKTINNTESPGPLPEAVQQNETTQTDIANASAKANIHSQTVVGHLDKSHITVHTYPESHPDNGISTFRADIDVSTCGEISPLKALNYLIHSFDSDIVTVDYRVRGFTRDVNGNKHFIDHDINSIQNYLSESTRERYQMIDVNVYQENIFHTKMLLKDFQLDDYLFGSGEDAFKQSEIAEIKQRLHHEMLEIFYGRNVAES